MIFETIHIENFFRVKNSTVNLKNQGLVLIEGANKDSDKSTSNGSGKSTIIEALLYCLWGDTVRGKSGDDVVRRQAGKDCLVSVVVNDDGIRYKITRHRKHSRKKNKIEIHEINEDGSPVVELTGPRAADTQKEIDRILGISFDTFIRGPLMPQGSFKRFSEMTDAGMKEVLENALSIATITKARTEALNKHKEVNGKIEIAKSKKDHCVQMLESAKDNLHAMSREQANWRVKTTMEAYRAYKEVVAVVGKIDETWDNLNVLQDVDELEKRYSKIAEYKSKIEIKYDSKINKIYNEVNSLSVDKKETVSSIARIENHIQKLTNLEDTTCPTCEQEVHSDYIVACLEPLHDDLSTLKANLEQLSEKISEGTQKLNSCKLEKKNALSKAETLIYQARDTVSMAKVEMKNQDQNRKALNDLQDQLYRARQAANNHWKILTDENPFDELVKKTEKSIEDLTYQLNNIETELSGLTDLSNLCQFWCKGFSNAGLKSHILASITPFMNKRVALYARELTDDEFKISFQTQTELASGEKREKFGVTVDNKHGSGSYSGDSAGEKAKADVAINFTISDLVATRSYKSYPQRFFDEPFESLDEAGIEAVIELLQKQVKHCGSIFVITHQAGMKSLFNKVITAVKEDGVTHIY